MSRVAWLIASTCSFAPAAELREGLVGVHVPRHREVGAIELEHDPGRVDLVVLGLHRVRQRGDVLLVAWVVLVGEEDRDHARRGGGHERVLDVGPGDRRLEVGDVGRAPRRGRDRRRARRTRAARSRARPSPAPCSRGTRPGRRAALSMPASPAEAVEPLLDVGRVADLARLAVVDDRHAGARLALRRRRRRPRGPVRRGQRRCSGRDRGPGAPRAARAVAAGCRCGW